MEQLLLHLMGDYLFQNRWMAMWKVRKSYVAAIHALVYTSGFFILLTHNPIALGVIFGTHCLIDRFSLAKYIMRVNGNAPNDTYTYSDGVVYPIFTGNLFLVYVVTDNTMHLIINYLALRL